MNALSVVIISKNEEHIIERTLRSALQVSNDIILVDAESQDNTVKIAEDLGASVFTKTWVGYGQAKNFGASKAKNDWVLSLDADELLSDDLISSINQMKFETGHIYKILIKLFYEGRIIRFSEMKPIWKKRLYNRQKVSWDEARVHEVLRVPYNFKFDKLNGYVKHYSYKDKEDLEFKTGLYAKLTAKKIYHSDKNHGILKRRFSPYFRFFKSYILQLGILEGKEGFLFSYMSYKSAKLRYQHLKQLRKSGSKN